MAAEVVRLHPHSLNFSMLATDVFKSPQFQKLSPQQRVFIETLVENGWDKLAAAHTAWQCKDDTSASAMAATAMRNPKIGAIIALIDPAKSRMTREEALELAAKHARTAAKPAESLKALEMIARWEGWDAETPRITSSPEGSIYDQAAALEKEQK
jgi:hypothetical protein